MLFSLFSFRNADLWPLDQIFWNVTQTTLIAVHLRPFASESTGKRRNERVHRAPKCWFSFFRSVTLTYDLWIKFSERCRKLLWLSLSWDLLQANWPVNEEMRGYTGPKMRIFLYFFRCDLDLGLLGQIFSKVTQTTLTAVKLRPFASELTGKRRNEMVIRALKCWFCCFCFLSVTLTYDLWIRFSEEWRNLLWLQLIWGFCERTYR